MERIYSVFISSTSADLDPHREVARQEIERMGWRPEMMENWGTDPRDTVDACYAKLEKCDAMLLIVAWRQGWVPRQEQKGNGKDSVTALEFQHAKEKKIPVLTMLAKDSWPGSLWDHGAAYDWVRSFRENLNRMAVFFDHESSTAGARESQLPQFRAKVTQVLVAHQKTLIAKSPEGPLNRFEMARLGLLEGNSIPFVGAGVYGAGPLSETALLKTFLKSGIEEDACLATAAEYYQGFCRGRIPFIAKLRQSIEDQTLELQDNVPAVYKLLLRVRPSKLKSPPRIVSVTLDMVFEDFLLRNGKSWNLVCHVLRTVPSTEHAGKLLVFHNGQLRNIGVWDSIDRKLIDDADYVIYKPLGSPLLHDHTRLESSSDSKSCIDPDVEIDTVVITETDHQILLEHDKPQIPPGVHVQVQKSPFLFLGMELHRWNYRFAMRMFRSAAGQRPEGQLNLAARKPASAMEELAWEGLATKLLYQEPNDFAEQVLASLKETPAANEEVARAS